ncbi:hypothetical protein OIU78_029749, partial [Salix suchowensis]
MLWLSLKIIFRILT